MLYSTRRWLAAAGGVGGGLWVLALAGCPRPAKGVAREDCDGLIDVHDADCLCSPGEVEECLYSGPPGTEGVGPCKAGERTCDETGAGHSECAGEITPAVEVCDTPEDEDCRGDAPDCGALSWLRIAGDGNVQSAAAVVGGAAGTVMIAGKIEGKLDLGQPLAAADVDMFVVSLDASGGHLWSRSFPGPDDQGATAAAAGPSGSVHVGGFFKKDFTLGTGTLTEVGGLEGFVLSLDADGDPSWARKIASPADDAVTDMAADGQGGLVVTGVMKGPAKLEGTVLPYTAGIDTFVARYTADGDLLWATALSGPGDQEPGGVAVGPGGAVVVTGRFEEALECGMSCSFSGTGDIEMFVLSLDGATGAVSWANAYTGAGEQQARDVVVGADGAIFVTGSFTGSINLGPTSGTLLAAAGAAPDLFLGKLTAEGAHVWSRSAGDGAPQHGAALFAAPSGDLLLGGGYAGTVDLFGVSLPPAGAGPRPFVARLDASGQARWAVGSTGTGTGSVASVTLDLSGYALFTGDITGDVTMAGVLLAGAGQKDVLVGSLAY